MLVIRLAGLLALLVVGGSLAAWMLTGNPRYRDWAWTSARILLVVVLLFFLLLAFERLFGSPG